MAKTGRYQSRLLNYLADQTHRLNAEAGRRLRQVRTGLTWSAQILIYPLYVAFQTTRWAGRQLGRAKAVPPQQRFGAAAQGQSGGSPSADAMIQAVVALGQQLAEGEAIALSAPLTSDSPVSSPPAVSAPIAIPAETAALTPTMSQAVEAIASTSQALTPTALTPAASLASASNPCSGSALQTGPEAGLQIRAVASQLANRALVLVDNENRSVPLAAEQQWSLQQALVQAVADFHYRRRQQQLAQAPPSPLPLPLPRPNQLPGVRWFGRLMGWMQTSPLAVSANLFEEARLPLGAIAPPPLLYWDHELNQALTAQALARLDGPLSQWETQLETGYQAKVQQSDRWRSPVVFAAKLFGFEEAAEQWLAAREQAAPAAQQVPGQSEAPAHGGLAQGELAQHHYLAQAGLAQRNWVQGNLGQGNLAQRPAAPISLPKAAPSAPAPNASTPNALTSNALAQTPSQAKPSTNVTIAARIAAAFSFRAAPVSAIAPPPASAIGATGARGDRAPSAPPHPSHSPGDPATALAQEAAADATYEPPYIETTASFSGYEKHPLEWLLDWIDRGLLWLEQQGSRLWQWLRRLPQG